MFHKKNCEQTIDGNPERDWNAIWDVGLFFGLPSINIFLHTTLDTVCFRIGFYFPVCLGLPGTTMLLELAICDGDRNLGISQCLYTHISESLGVIKPHKLTTTHKFLHFLLHWEMLKSYSTRVESPFFFIKNNSYIFQKSWASPFVAGWSHHWRHQHVSSPGRQQLWGHCSSLAPGARWKADVVKLPRRQRWGRPWVVWTTFEKMGL